LRAATVALRCWCVASLLHCFPVKLRPCIAFPLSSYYVALLPRGVDVLLCFPLRSSARFRSPGFPRVTTRQAQVFPRLAVGVLRLSVCAAPGVPSPDSPQSTAAGRQRRWRASQTRSAHSASCDAQFLCRAGRHLWWTPPVKGRSHAKVVPWPCRSQIGPAKNLRQSGELHEQTPPLAPGPEGTGPATYC
jgi:hypothetical protein